MIFTISYKDMTKSGDLFVSQFILRHSEFIERQAYDVHTLDGMEYDEYDTLATHYLVYSDDGKTALGCSRLTPVARGSMLRDHFGDLVSNPSIFDEPRLWEGTRFCIDSRLAAEKRKSIVQHLALAYIEFGLFTGIDKIIGLMPTLILRSVFERNGIGLERLGPPKAIGAHSKIQAAAIAISRAQLKGAEAATGLFNVLGLDPSRSSPQAASA